MKKNLLILLFLFLMIFPNLYSQEHLEPVDGAFIDGENLSTHYQADVNRVLTTGNIYSLLRMIVLPSFENEWLISLETDKNKSDKYVLIAHTAKKQIWSYLMEPGSNPAHINIEVLKKRKTIDKKLASKIISIWTKFLKDVRYGNGSGSGGIDGTTYLFDQYNYGWRCGQIWSPKSYTKTGYLVKLGTKLYEFANAGKQKEDKIMDEINSLIETKLN